MGVFFISDLHLGHPAIINFADGKFRRWNGLDNIDDHDDELIHRINQKVRKRDKLFILGDIVFNKKNLYKLQSINHTFSNR